MEDARGHTRPKVKLPPLARSSRARQAPVPPPEPPAIFFLRLTPFCLRITISLWTSLSVSPKAVQGLTKRQWGRGEVAPFPVSPFPRLSPRPLSAVSGGEPHAAQPWHDSRPYSTIRHSRMPPENSGWSCTSMRRPLHSTGLKLTRLKASSFVPKAPASSTGFQASPTR